VINKDKLIAAFAKAGLKLEVVKTPMRKGAGMESIIQIDVQRKLSGSQRGEWYRMYIPPVDVTISVRDSDDKLKQLVLLVKENKSEFEETLEHPRWAHGDNRNFEAWIKNVVRENQVNILRKVPNPSKGRPYVVVRRKTDSNTRYFLMGEDERQLFVAQLRNAATTVQQAHSQLGSTVQFAEGKRRGSSIDRQGEWFFLETSQVQRDHIETLIKKNQIGVNKKVPIGRFIRRPGQPHTVDELVVLGGDKVTNKLGHGFSVRPTQVYIRGAVRHPDHKTQKFHQWREVVANNEGATSQASAGGVFWVD
jgi:hypothetical protein